MNGFLLIDKDSGMTSFDVVRSVRRLFNMKKVGHSGTLDPLATGLLIVALGRGTRLLEFFLKMDKVYEVVVRFGAVSDSFDADGEIEHVSDLVVSREDVEKAVLESFLGRIVQVPPRFSALKVEGRRAYELAREGVDFKMTGREVDIFSFDMLDYTWPAVKFRIHCSSGTYIRSLAHDLGGVLGVGGYVEELRRVSIGDFSVEDAVRLSDFEGNDLNKKNEQALVSMSSVGRKFPYVDLDIEEFEELKFGREIMNKKNVQPPFSLAFYNDELVGVLTLLENGRIRFKKMFLDS